MRNIIILFIVITATIFTYRWFDLDQVEVEPVTIPGTQQIVDIAVPTVEPEPREPSEYICVGEYCDGSMSGDDLSSITVLQIPVVTSNGNIGCGNGIIFAPHAVPRTQAVLNASYEKLFDLKYLPEIEADDVRNVVALEDMLFYSGVSLDDSGTAKLLLEGESTQIYNCTIPTFKAQIEQTALQFDTVNSLEVYLNDELWDWCDFSQADPSEDGCDVNPKYWISVK